MRNSIIKHLYQSSLIMTFFFIDEILNNDTNIISLIL